jgi:hypothetical protein
MGCPFKLRRVFDCESEARMRFMRRVLPVVLALCSGIFVGCFTPPTEHTAARYPSPFEGPTGDNVVLLLVALVERPVGDRAINEEIWELADEQGIDLEHKTVVYDNGFRVGQFGSQPPASLRDLIRSERSCANPRQIRLHAGNATTVVLGSTQSHSFFQLVKDADKTSVELDQAQCQLQIVPTLLPDGHTRLQITPVVKHGQPSVMPRAVQEPSGTLRWDMRVQQPLETYSNLGWQQTVDDSDYLIIGTRLDHTDTLGQLCFIQTDGEPPIQRLLVLRAMRGGSDAHPIEEVTNRSSTIAAQAGLQTARGAHP